MNQRQAKQVAHALVAEAIRNQIMAWSGYGHLPLTEADEDRLEKALDKMAHRHARYAGHRSPDAIIRGEE